MADTRVFTVSRFEADSLEFFGIEPFIAHGAFFGHDPNETLTVDDARSVIESWLGASIPSGGPPTVPLVGGWRSPVATTGDLPMGFNGPGDVRLVMEDFSVWAWDPVGVAWVAVAAGGVPTSSTTTPNLFVQQAQPAGGSLLVNSLWIPTDGSGVPLAVSQWEVYADLGDGDGGNLFVQEDAPSPTVDALWVPLNPDGTPKYILEWEVFTGHGSQPSIGNPNLIIQSALPGSPPTGSLFIPLNTDQSSKSPDLWRVYA